MHRVFCQNIPAIGGIAELEAREKEHLFKVFRARSGDAVEVLDGCGVRASGVVEDGRIVRISGREELPEPEEKLCLCCALPRKQKLDQMLKQAAELGAWSIRPVKCMRSVAEGGPRERWDLLLREACKQSGNPFLPSVEAEKTLPAVLEDLKNEGFEIYYGSVTPAAAGRSVSGKKAVLIGPEGGFAPEEFEMMKKYGAIPLNLGPYVLRLETAAIGALTALRMLGGVMLAALVLLISGCGNEGSHPLLVKGRNLRASGDVRSARDYFRRAIAMDPDNPDAYIALAQVCDEDLNEPLEAIFAYELYIKLMPEDSADRDTAVKILAGLKERAVQELSADTVLCGECENLKKEVAGLQDKNLRMEKLLVVQQKTLVQLRAKLKSAEVKR